MSDDDRRKIDQYLDASRSELLFARRAVLVEGIAEAVLLPVLARKCVFAGDDYEARTNRRAIAGASVINVGSVDFAPYLKLLAGKFNGHRLIDRLVVITDGDPALAEDTESTENTVADELAGSGGQQADGDNGDDPVDYNRVADLEQRASTLDASDSFTSQRHPTPWRRICWCPAQATATF